jgi:hypothetical protein|tara:strand:- start:61 stop:318 length:258 start_codon:yes stop_codon:yes gene_type:complete
MKTKQINLKLPLNLFESAQKYVQDFGFRNIQELASESIREKIFDKKIYDEKFSEEEVEMIDKLISLSIKKGDIVSEEELNKTLLG